MPPLPAFRQLLKVVPFEHEGMPAFRVQDQAEGLFDHVILLPALAFVVARFLDGRLDAEGVRKAILEQIPQADLTVENILQIVADLDQHYLLESERVRARRTETQQAWHSSPTRAPKFVPGTR